MTPITRPYNVDPYEFITEHNCPWIDSYNALIVKTIDEAKNTIKQESLIDRNPYLIDESFLYECFKDNCEHGLVKDNWQVLKYFTANMSVKLFKDMIGKWEFTTENKEMYDYFRTMKVSETDRCTAPKLHFKYKKIPYYNGGWLISDDKPTAVDYFIHFYRDRIRFADLYEQMFTSLYTMVRNAKGLQIYEPCYNRPLFEYKTIHLICYYEYCPRDFKEYCCDTILSFM